MAMSKRAGESDRCPKCDAELRLVLCASCFGTGRSNNRSCKTCGGARTTRACPNLRSHKLWSWMHRSVLWPSPNNGRKPWLGHWRGFAGHVANAFRRGRRSIVGISGKSPRANLVFCRVASGIGESATHRGQLAAAVRLPPERSNPRSIRPTIGRDGISSACMAQSPFRRGTAGSRVRCFHLRSRWRRPMRKFAIALPACLAWSGPAFANLQV